MSGVALVLHQFRFDQKIFWRNPAAVFFTALLPLIFLFILASVFNDADISTLDVKGATYYVPAILTLAVISGIMVVLVSAIGALVYGVTIPTDTLPALLVTLAVGAFSFSCLGFALAAVIPTEDAAPAVTNATVLPLYFLSGVFIPEDELPNGILNFADVFPIRHFFEALFTAWDPNTTGAGFEWGHLAVVAAWGLFGLLVAVRFFRWEPRR